MHTQSRIYQLTRYSTTTDDSTCKCMRNRTYINSQIQHKCWNEVFGICPCCKGQSGILALELHHIDFNVKNDDYNNLIYICTICHASASNEVIKPCSLHTLKAILKSGQMYDTFRKAFIKLITYIPAHTIHDMLRSNSRRKWGHLEQGILLLSNGIEKFKLNDRLRALALLSLIQLKRRFGNRYLRRINSDLELLRKEIVYVPHMADKLIYEQGYISHLENNIPKSLLLLEDSKLFSDTNQRAYIDLVKSAILMNTKMIDIKSMNIKNIVNRLRDCDPLLYQTGLYYLTLQYLEQGKLDDAEKVMLEYTAINPLVLFDELSAPYYFRGRIAMVNKNYDEAIRNFQNCLDIKIQTYNKYGIAELRFYIGKACQFIAKEDGDVLAEKESKNQYYLGIKEEIKMGNLHWNKLCRIGIESIS